MRNVPLLVAFVIVCSLLLSGTGIAADGLVVVTRQGNLECGLAGGTTGDRCEPHSEQNPRDFLFEARTEHVRIDVVLEWESSSTVARTLALSVASPWLNETAQGRQGYSPLQVNLTGPPSAATPFNVTVNPSAGWVADPAPYSQSFNVTLRFYTQEGASTTPPGPDAGPPTDGDPAPSSQPDSPPSDPEPVPRDEPPGDPVLGPAGTGPAAAAGRAPATTAGLWEDWGTETVVVTLSLLVIVPVRRLVWGFVVRLFSRIDRDELLDHPRRRALVDAVAARPGVRHEALRNRLRLANGVFEHHVQRLVDEGLLVRHRGPDGAVAYTTPDRRPVTSPRRTRVPERILETVLGRPGLSQTQLAERLDLSLQLVNYHVRRMARSDRIEIVEDGRSTRLYPGPR